MAVCRDNLAGTDVYGTYEANPLSGNTFSIAYAGLITSDTDIMFMSGDRKHYLVTKHVGLSARGLGIPLTVSFSSGDIGLIIYLLD